MPELQSAVPEETSDLVTPKVSTFVTVAEASQELGVSAPRLRRLLARSEWIGRTETRTRRTRTGTRTGTVLNSSLLDELRAILDSSEASIEVESDTDEQERERIVTGTRTGTSTVRNENENGSNGSASHLDTATLREELARVTAERDGLTARLADAQKATADTASDRDAWKEQASSLTESLRAAQDEARAARLMPSRAAMQIEASSLTAGDSGTSEDSGGGITTPDAVRAPWWAFWRSSGASGKGRG